MAQVRLIEPINKANGTLPLPQANSGKSFIILVKFMSLGNNNICTNTKYLKSVLRKTLPHTSPTHMKYVYEAVTKSFK